MHRKVKPGFRYFQCSCGHSWREGSRDYLTPSVSDCPVCNEIVSPFKAEENLDLVKAIEMPDETAMNKGENNGKN